MTGILYTIATPIGNLEDITKRAVKTLETVDYILCEDKRVSAKLLSHFNISKKLFAYHKFNEKEQLAIIIENLKNGANIALISDAGTPCISDPGRILVNELYKNNIKVVPIPGACAVSTFLSAVTKNDEEYAFAGFVPRTAQEQEKLFEKFSDTDLVFYDSPNRLIKTLENIVKFRDKNALISVGRELTKIHEEIKTDTAENLLKYYSENPPKGEIALMLYKKPQNTVQETDIINKIKVLQGKGFSTKDISVILSTLYNINKNTVYNLISAQ